MSSVTYGSRTGRIRVTAVRKKTTPARPVADVVRELKAARLADEDAYRERSLALHGLLCGRCGREFDAANRHLLTVHHKDGNHQNNPLDGSNWENLCVYCHEDVHSRGVLGDYLEGSVPGMPREEAVVYRGEKAEGPGGMGLLGDRLKDALEKKNRR